MLGFLLHLSILWSIGIILLVIGVILVALGPASRLLAGRRRYW